MIPTSRKILHLHGGAYIAGSAFGYRPLASLLTLRQQGLPMPRAAVDTHDFHIFWSFLPEAASAMRQEGGFVRDAMSRPIGE